MRNLDLTPIDFRVILSLSLVCLTSLRKSMQSKDKGEWKPWLERINVRVEDNGGNCGTNACSYSPITGGGVFLNSVQIRRESATVFIMFACLTDPDFLPHSSATLPSGAASRCGWCSLESTHLCGLPFPWPLICLER